MRILAIDPGYDRLGVAVVEKQSGKEVALFSSCIRTPKGSPHEKRLAHIGKEIRIVVEEFEPEALAIETLFLANNQKTVMPVAEARGVCLYEAAIAGLQVFEYTPLQIKVAVTGYGKSDKAQVIVMVKRLVKLDERKKLDDEYYAIAIGLTCFASEKLNKP